MPSLAVSTSNNSSSAAPTSTHNTSTSARNPLPPSHTPRSPISRSASPVPPPVSPITPTLSPARLAANSNSNVNANPNANVNSGPGARNVMMGLESQSLGKLQPNNIGGKNIAVMNSHRAAENTVPQQIRNHPSAQAQAHSSRETYTHTQQMQQISIPQPKPQEINFNENPDVLAMKSTISILQLQARNAERDMVALQRIKERAVGDPEGFVRSLGERERREKEEDMRRKNRKVVVDGDGKSESSSDEDEGSEMEGLQEENGGVAAGDATWEKLPTPQNIVRCPPVNWAKYGVVGESLDRLHEDQIRRPSEGHPAKINADGSTTHKFGDGTKKEYVMKKPVGLGEVGPKPKKKKSLSSK
ncbi:hypothetical protein SBOR_1010 [Sclerotinia borealis F-4128]|uniref:Uncharacterized protein n=1 Tax=Sclerotinia borealis (strain F-4128) TaxID=1432307 RepID=W9CVJ0_SCLBF|nr:hypothetical protein SBOR_1010 [Sclerotinia borealis F-4128]